jgi:hypothetical protein
MNTAKKHRTIGSRGESMVEVIVAFAVSMTMIVLFGQIVHVSVQFLETSQELKEEETSFEAEFYQKTAQESMQTIAGVWYLKLDTEHTDSKNYGNESDIQIPLDRVQLKVYENQELNIRRYVISSEIENEN